MQVLSLPMWGTLLFCQLMHEYLPHIPTLLHLTVNNSENSEKNTIPQLRRQSGVVGYCRKTLRCPCLQSVMRRIPQCIRVYAHGGPAARGERSCGWLYGHQDGI